MSSQFRDCLDDDEREQSRLHAPEAVSMSLMPLLTYLSRCDFNIKVFTSVAMIYASVNVVLGLIMTEGSILHELNVLIE